MRLRVSGVSPRDSYVASGERKPSPIGRCSSVVVRSMCPHYSRFCEDSREAGMLKILRVHSERLRAEVYALRHKASRHGGSSPANPRLEFRDAYDDQQNHILWALADNGKLVGSIRVTW